MAEGRAAPVEIRRDLLDAVIFDLDGVITDTASVHAAAWKRMFDSFLAGRAGGAGEEHPPFSQDDYLRYVDGKPRYDGVESFLASRGISLPRGEPGDPASAETVCGLGNRKDELFGEVLRRDGVAAFPSSVELLGRLREGGFATAIISASRNCAQVLRAAGASELFDVKVDGVDADALGLRGKPDPAVFLEAAGRLEVEPGRAGVVEDALAGVEAGRSGGFGLVIGVDRAGQAEALLEHGADVVVGDLAEVRVVAGGAGVQ
ncbi:MAG: HAD family hydrolase [Solirubrobacterales bacterium]